MRQSSIAFRVYLADPQGTTSGGSGVGSAGAGAGDAGDAAGDATSAPARCWMTSRHG